MGWATSLFAPRVSGAPACTGTASNQPRNSSASGSGSAASHRLCSRHSMPLTSDGIRARFVQCWQERGSRLVPSASLIPHDDPTVLFTIAGMQQFVPYFLGRQEAPFRRYTSVQKTFRTSDIDEVGDPSHLTFFEMLG